MFGVVWDYSCLKLKGKKHEQNTLLESSKNEIKSLANPGLA